MITYKDQLHAFESQAETMLADVRADKSVLICNNETAYQVVIHRDGQSVDVLRRNESEVTMINVFVLRGAGLLVANGQEVYCISGGHHALYRVPASYHVTIAPSSALDFHAVIFQFSARYLLRLCPDLRLLANVSISSSLQSLGNNQPTATDAEQRALISNICNSALPEHLQAVYKDIKIAELLVLQLAEILNGSKASDTTGLREYELQRVYQVRDILQSAPGKSYTLLGLAHEVGTNDATLKKHFKQVFGCTVFAYLTSCRMESAKHLLLEDRKTVAEIAQYLGYKHVSHFSSAFRKYYGHAPTKFFETN